LETSEVWKPGFQIFLETRFPKTGFQKQVPKEVTEQTRKRYVIETSLRHWS